jgi:hypothetical protein
MRGDFGTEVADIFRQYGPDYRASHGLPRNQRRAMFAIEECRTAALGGHRYEYDCDHVDISYNSCRNRHCPKCQTLRKEKWIDARCEDLLPIPYFHAVFTIPSKLNPLVIMNPRTLYTVLFRSVSETLIELSLNPKHLGARIGFISVLHTWGQNLMHHPHIHCIVPGGGLSPDGTQWVSCRRKDFFIHVKVLSKKFAGKFLDYLKESFESAHLIFPGDIRHLKDPGVFESFRSQFYHKKWVVYCKPPFEGPESVLQYLGRYTHRIAISNNRILKIEDGTVSFLWRDYADGDKQKTMQLKANDFIGRFLLHVLPDRYMRIRHFGLLANRSRKDNISLCRALLGDCKIVTKEKDKPETWQEQLLRICGIDVTLCPVCRKGKMISVEVLPPSRCNSPPGQCR